MINLLLSMYWFWLTHTPSKQTRKCIHDNYVVWLQLACFKYFSKFYFSDIAQCNLSQPRFEHLHRYWLRKIFVAFFSALKSFELPVLTKLASYFQKAINENTQETWQKMNRTNLNKFMIIGVDGWILLRLLKMVCLCISKLLWKHYYSNEMTLTMATSLLLAENCRQYQKCNASSIIEVYSELNVITNRQLASCIHYIWS